MSGRVNRQYDEQWICVRALAERSQGGLGPFQHKGDVWTVSYILRSPENRAKVDVEKMQIATELGAAREAGKPFKLPNLDVLNSARPGDVVVDRSLRTVYLIEKDGSRRRCDDPEAKEAAINAVKQLLLAIKTKADTNDPPGK